MDKNAEAILLHFSKKCSDQDKILVWGNYCEKFQIYIFIPSKFDPLFEKNWIRLDQEFGPCVEIFKSRTFLAFLIITVRNAYSDHCELDLYTVHT